MRSVRLCLVFLASYCAVVLGAPGADVIITCPQAFRDKDKNVITCVFNNTSIATRLCAVQPSQVNFVLTRRTETSSSSVCTAPYPCTTTSHPTATSPCSCTDKTPAGIFSYTFLFVANKTIDDNGTFACKACAGPVTEHQENCKSVDFEPDDVDNDSPGNPTNKHGNTASKTSYESYDGDIRAAGVDADSNSPGDRKGSSSGSLALIIKATAGGVSAVAMVIGTAAWFYKKRSSGGHNARSVTPPPIVETAGPSADRGLVVRPDVTPTEEDDASETSDLSDVSDSVTSEEL